MNWIMQQVDYTIRRQNEEPKLTAMLDFQNYCKDIVVATLFLWVCLGHSTDSCSLLLVWSVGTGKEVGQVKCHLFLG